MVRDTARKLAHAVLLVEVDGRWQVLDNLSNQILSPADIRHYRPYYSANEEMRWLHLQPARSADAAMSVGAEHSSR